MRHQLALLLVILLSISAHAAGIDTYANGDNLNIKLKLQQDNTGDPSSHKHLQYTVANQKGEIIASNQNRAFVLLNGYGDYIKALGDPTSGLGIIVNDDWFESTEGERSTDLRQWWSKTPNTLQRKEQVTAIQPGSLSLKRGDIETTQSRQYTLKLTKQGQDVTYQILRGGTYQSGQGYTGGSNLGCAGQASEQQTITCQDEGFVLTVRLTTNIPRDNNEEYHVHMNFNAQTGYDPCSPENRIKPQPFTVTFTVYDSDEYGQPMQQISIDPITGEDVTAQTTIYATCAQAGEPVFKAAKERAAGLLFLKDVTKDLPSKLDNMLRAERVRLEEVSIFINDRQITSKLDQVKQKLQEIKQEEAAFDQQLIQYFADVEKLSQDRPQNQTIQQFKTTLNQLHEVLRQHPPEDYTNPTQTMQEHNVPYQVDTAIDTIEIQQGNTPPNREPVLDRLRVVLGGIELGIGFKEDLLSALGRETGIAEATCPVGTDTLGNYYVCSVSPPGDDYNRDEQNRPCPSPAETCYVRRAGGQAIFSQVSTDINALIADETAAKTAIQEHITDANIKTNLPQVVTTLNNLIDLEEEGTDTIETFTSVLAPDITKNTDISSVHNRLNTLLNNIRESQDQENVIRAAKDARTHTQTISQGGTVPTDGQIQQLLTKLRTVSSNIDALQEHKQNVISQIQSIVGVQACPDGQVVNGFYYFCDPDPDNPFYTKVPEYVCQTATEQTCYKMPEATLDDFISLLRIQLYSQLYYGRELEELSQLQYDDQYTNRSSNILYLLTDIADNYDDNIELLEERHSQLPSALRQQVTVDAVIDAYNAAQTTASEYEQTINDALPGQEAQLLREAITVLNERLYDVYTATLDLLDELRPPETALLIGTITGENTTSTPHRESVLVSIMPRTQIAIRAQVPRNQQKVYYCAFPVSPGTNKNLACWDGTANYNSQTGQLDTRMDTEAYLKSLNYEETYSFRAFYETGESTGRTPRVYTKVEQPKPITLNDIPGVETTYTAVLASTGYVNNENRNLPIRYDRDMGLDFVAFVPEDAQARRLCILTYNSNDPDKQKLIQCYTASFRERMPNNTYMIGSSIGEDSVDEFFELGTAYAARFEFLYNNDVYKTNDVIFR